MPNKDSGKSNHEDKSSEQNNKSGFRTWHIVVVIAILAFAVITFGMVHMQRSCNDDRFMPAFSQIRGRRMHENRSFLNIDNNTAYSGVVTSVKDNSFTLSGNGQQATVNTSDSTTFNNTSKEVTVNDTVIVFGTKSDNTITATSVRVMNI